MNSHQFFFHQYRTMYRHYINRVNYYLGRHKLYSGQWAIMKFIINNGPHSLVEIAEVQNVEKPTITRSVQRLIELDYVEVIPGKDRREKRIQLTTLGKEISAEVEVSVKEFQLEALEGISPEEQIEAGRILGLVKQNLMK